MFVQYYKSDVSVEETFGVPLMAMTVDFLLLFYFVFFFFLLQECLKCGK